jgi:hypothetical protein
MLLGEREILEFCSTRVRHFLWLRRLGTTQHLLLRPGMPRTQERCKYGAGKIAPCEEFLKGPISLVSLTRRKGALVDNILGVLLIDLTRTVERRTWKSHKTWRVCVSVCNRLYKESSIYRDDSPVLALSKIPNGAINFMKLSIREGFADTSTMQLLVLMSKTLPPNWWVKCVMCSKCWFFRRSASEGARLRGW